jgi:hypothetical protein
LKALVIGDVILSTRLKGLVNAEASHQARPVYGDKQHEGPRWRLLVNAEDEQLVVVTVR